MNDTHVAVTPTIDGKRLAILGQVADKSVAIAHVYMEPMPDGIWIRVITRPANAQANPEFRRFVTITPELRRVYYGPIKAIIWAR